MIKRFQVQNYKCLRDVTLDLTPIHVLIGPNDSGKTSILEAIAALCRSVDHPLADAFTGSWEGRTLVWHGHRDVPISFSTTIGLGKEVFEYSLSCAVPAGGLRKCDVHEESATRKSTSLHLSFGAHGIRSGVAHITATGTSTPTADSKRLAEDLHNALAGLHSYRWNPSFLALPVAPDANRRFRMEPSGFGLALCLDDILGFDRHRFDCLESRLQKVFPDIKSIKLMPEPAYRAPVDDPAQVTMLEQSDGKGIYFEFKQFSQLVSASQVSDGVLLVLAYLTVLHLPEPPRVLLVEEPENGIHPKRLQDVLKILRELVEGQDHTQVILTTHSPYVVDMFKPEEVTLCHKEKDGAVSVRRLSESKTVREQLDVFTLGEIWTSEGDEALAKPSAEDKEAGR